MNPQARTSLIGVSLALAYRLHRRTARRARQALARPSRSRPSDSATSMPSTPADMIPPA